MLFSNPYLDYAALLLLWMLAWFILALILRRNDIVDIAWGLGFIFLTALSFFKTSFWPPLKILTSALVLIWGFRLSIYLFLRNRQRGEDFRYRAWREQWGQWFILRSFFQIYILQGALLYLIALPILFLNTSITGISYSLSAILGTIVWTAGFLIESISDYQMLSFKKDPQNRGKIIQSGFWKFSRHPNYFGEILVWWGIGLISFNSPYGAIVFLSPLLLTFLIIFVSGIPMLEKKYEGRADFEAYKKKTPCLIPGIKLK